MVADDHVAANALQKSIMEISAPQGLKVAIGSVQDVCTQLRAAAFDTERVILLFSNPSDVLRALKSGLDCRVLNIGGMHYVQGKRKLMDVLAVDDADLDALREIAARGVKVDIQTVPTQRPLPLNKVFKACHLAEKP
jgi:PTS system mannose-specific IIB component